jgi:hypothetical protein
MIILLHQSNVSHDGVAAMAMGPINLDSHLCGPISRPLFAPLLPGKEKWVYQF